MELADDATVEENKAKDYILDVQGAADAAKRQMEEGFSAVKSEIGKNVTGFNEESDDILHKLKMKISEEVSTISEPIEENVTKTVNPTSPTHWTRARVKAGEKSVEDNISEHKGTYIVLKFTIGHQRYWSSEERDSPAFNGRLGSGGR